MAARSKKCAVCGALSYPSDARENCAAHLCDDCYEALRIGRTIVEKRVRGEIEYVRWNIEFSAKVAREHRGVGTWEIECVLSAALIQTRWGYLLMPKVAAVLMNRLKGMISGYGATRYREGFNEGRALLRGLAAGKISVREYEDRIAERNT